MPSPLQMVIMEFNPKHNVKAVKGFAMKHISKGSEKKVNPSNIVITLNEQTLKDNVKLADLNCADTPLVVNYRL